MASDYYVLLDGVNGESQAVGMTNYIELDSFSFAHPTPPMWAARVSRRQSSLSDFSFTCGLDSPATRS